MATDGRSAEDELDDDFLRFDDSDAQDDGRNEDNDADSAMDESDMQEEDNGVENRVSPWIDEGISRVQLGSMHPLLLLHNEIVGFCRLMEPRPEELQQRLDVVARFEELAEKAFGVDAKVEVFGSQVTGLCLPSSDIDIVIQLPVDDGDGDASRNTDDRTDRLKSDSDGSKEAKPSQPGTSTGDYNEGRTMLELTRKSPLVHLGDTIRSEWGDDLAYLEVIENTRVPLVKFILKSSGIAVDVCFNQDTGPQAAQLVKQYMDIMPPLRPLTFLLKFFLAARGLNQPYTGGVGSFTLQMMILSFLQHREREIIHYNRPLSQNLGTMLIDFLVLYSTDFNFITTGFTVRFDGMYFPKGASDRKEFFWQPDRQFSMAIENPLDPSADVGKPSFRVQFIQRSFEVAYKLLLSRIAEPNEDSPSLLSVILPITDEMLQRKRQVANNAL